MAVLRVSSLPLRGVLAIRSPGCSALSRCLQKSNPLLYWTSRFIPTRSLQSSPFSTTCGSYAARPGFTEGELEICRQGLLEGKTREQIIDLVRTDTRPTPDFESLIFQAAGHGALREHAKRVRASMSRHRPHNLSRKWTEEELHILQKGINEGRSMYDIATELGRPLMATKVMRATLSKRLNPWSTEEQHTLRQMTENGKSLAAIGDVLRRKPSSVHAKQVALGLKPYVPRGPRHEWTGWQADELLGLYRDGLNDKQIREKLSFKVSLSAISGKRQTMGLIHPATRPKYWTAEESRTVQELYPLGWNDRAIAERLGRPIVQVSAHRRQFALKRGTRVLVRWSSTDEERLHEMVKSGMSNEEIAQQLSVPRTVKSVALKSVLLGLRRGDKSMEYTREEVDLVQDLAAKGFSNKQIRERLGGRHTIASIAKKKNYLGFRRAKKSVEYTKEEVEIIRDMAEKDLSNKQIQEKLGGTRTTDSIANKKHYLGFRRVKKPTEALVQKPDNDTEGEL